MKRKLVFAALVGVTTLVVVAGPAAAQADAYDRTVATGAEAMNMVVLDNIFVFLSGVLVFLMQPGFALVEAGLTRAKNAANIKENCDSNPKRQRGTDTRRRRPSLALRVSVDYRHWLQFFGNGPCCCRQGEVRQYNCRTN